MGACVGVAGEVEALEKGEILTEEEPGKWAGKQGGHVPKASKEGDKLVVKVEHGMAAEHWIQFIWCRSKAGKLLGAVKLKHTDKPELELKLPAGVDAVICYESCNLHGVWKKEVAL